MRSSALVFTLLSCLAGSSAAFGADAAADTSTDASDVGVMDADETPMPNLDIAYTNKGCTCGLSNSDAQAPDASGAVLLFALLLWRRRS